MLLDLRQISSAVSAVLRRHSLPEVTIASAEQCGYGDLYQTMRGFSRPIALWGFIAVQEFRADFGPDSFGGVLTVMAAVVCISQLACQIVLRFLRPAKRV